jgi:hypothetical protein
VGVRRHGKYDVTVRPSSALATIKLLHTVVWACFVGCILAIPVAAHFGRFALAGILIAVVFVEVLVLAANSGSCPLTGIAARYTSDRDPNFDIFLPLWVAKYNKVIFGALFVGGSGYALYKWWSGSAA